MAAVLCSPDLPMCYHRPATNACLSCSHYQVAFFRLHSRHLGVFNILSFLRVREVRGQLFCFLLTLVAVYGGFLWLGSRDGSGVSIPVWYRVALVLPWLEYKQGTKTKAWSLFQHCGRKLWTSASSWLLFLLFTWKFPYTHPSLQGLLAAMPECRCEDSPAVSRPHAGLTPGNMRSVRVSSELPKRNRRFYFSRKSLVG